MNHSQPPTLLEALYRRILELRLVLREFGARGQEMTIAIDQKMFDRLQWEVGKSGMLMALQPMSAAREINIYGCKFVPLAKAQDREKAE